MTVSRKTDDLLENDLRRLVSRSAHLVEKQMQLLEDNTDAVKSLVAELYHLKNIDSNVAESVRLVVEKALPDLAEKTTEALGESLNKDVEILGRTLQSFDQKLQGMWRKASEVRMWHWTDATYRIGWAFVSAFVGGFSAIALFMFLWSKRYIGF